ncbi:MAG: hypothetical protein ACRDVG_12330 [Jatrophihabitantaceae bacterium]
MIGDEDRLRELLRTAAPRFGTVDVDELVTRPAPRRRSAAAPAVAAAVALVVGIAVSVPLLRGPSRAPTATSRTPATTTPADLAKLTAKVSCTNDKRVHIAAPNEVRTLGAVAVVICDYGQRRYPDGVWSVRIKKVTTSGLAGLLAALDRPDTPATPGERCLDYLDLDPALYLVDADGKDIHPRYTRDGCGHLQRGAVKATDRLSWNTAGVTKVSLDIPNDPVQRECGNGWKDVISIEAGLKSSSAGGAELPSSTAIVCVYLVIDDPISGRYIRGVHLDPTLTAALRSALDRPGRPGTCVQQKKFAVVHDASGQLVYVELGGCWRVLRADGSVGRADAAGVQAALGS